MITGMLIVSRPARRGSIRNDIAGSPLPRGQIRNSQNEIRKKSETQNGKSETAVSGFTSIGCPSAFLILSSLRFRVYFGFRTSNFVLLALLPSHPHRQV